MGNLFRSGGGDTVKPITIVRDSQVPSNEVITEYETYPVEKYKKLVISAVNHMASQKNRHYMLAVYGDGKQIFATAWGQANVPATALDISPYKNILVQKSVLISNYYPPATTITMTFS